MVNGPPRNFFGAWPDRAGVRTPNRTTRAARVLIKALRAARDRGQRRQLAGGSNRKDAGITRTDRAHPPPWVGWWRMATRRFLLAVAVRALGSFGATARRTHRHAAVIGRAR